MKTIELTQVNSIKLQNLVSVCNLNTKLSYENSRNDWMSEQSEHYSLTKG